MILYLFVQFEVVVSIIVFCDYTLIELFFGVSAISTDFSLDVCTVSWLKSIVQFYFDGFFSLFSLVSLYSVTLESSLTINNLFSS